MAVPSTLRTTESRWWLVQRATWPLMWAMVLSLGFSSTIHPHGFKVPMLTALRVRRWKPMAPLAPPIYLPSTARITPIPLQVGHLLARCTLWNRVMERSFCPMWHKPTQDRPPYGTVHCSSTARWKAVLWRWSVSLRSTQQVATSEEVSLWSMMQSST